MEEGKRGPHTPPRRPRRRPKGYFGAVESVRKGGNVISKRKPGRHGQLRQFGRFIPSPVAMEAIADDDMADSAVDLR